jgi:hypothetical protein
MRMKMSVEERPRAAARQRRHHRDGAGFERHRQTIANPQVFRARTAFEVGTLRKSTTAVPIVTRMFSRTERLLMRFEVYGPGAAPPSVEMRLLNRWARPTGRPSRSQLSRRTSSKPT